MLPSYFLGWLFSAWLAILVALIAYRVVTGKISLDGLVTIDGDRFSPERLQLLLVTLGLIAAYVTQAVSAGNIPEISNEVIVVLAASHGVYLGGKFAGR